MSGTGERDDDEIRATLRVREDAWAGPGAVVAGSGIGWGPRGGRWEEPLSDKDKPTALGEDGKDGLRERDCVRRIVPARSRGRCGIGESSPGADVAGGEPSPGAEVAAVRPRRTRAHSRGIPLVFKQLLLSTRGSLCGLIDV